MTKTITTRYDVAEHLRTPEEMAAYLEACLEEANGDAAFIARVWAILPAPKACLRWHVMLACLAKVFTRHSPGNETQVLTQSSRS